MFIDVFLDECLLDAFFHDEWLHIFYLKNSFLQEQLYVHHLNKQLQYKHIQ